MHRQSPSTHLWIPTRMFRPLPVRGSLTDCAAATISSAKATRRAAWWGVCWIRPTQPSQQSPAGVQRHAAKSVRARTRIVIKIGVQTNNFLAGFVVTEAEARAWTKQQGRGMEEKSQKSLGNSPMVSTLYTEYTSARVSYLKGKTKNFI